MQKREENTRLSFSRRSILKGTAATGIGLSGLGAFSGSAAAAPGDVLATVSLPNTPGGVGLTFNGEYVMVPDGYTTTQIDIYTPPMGTGTATYVASKTLPNGISGIEWDPTRGKLWATEDGDPFYLIDIGDPTVSGPVSSMNSQWSAPADSQGWPADGIAFDARDDTIWWSKDNSVDPSDGNRKVWKLNASDGSVVRDITPKFNSAGDLFPHISGVALGADLDGRPTLYLGSNPGADSGSIVRVYADGDAEWISDFATGTGFRVEDMTCDPFTYAPKEALIVKDSTVGEYKAFEVEAGTCFSACLQEVSLLADQDEFIGSVIVDEDPDEIHVTYSLSGDWYMTESHLHVAENCDDIPQNRPGNPKVGQFELSMDHDPAVQEFTYTLDKDEYGFGPGDELCIAAHADVFEELGGETGVFDPEYDREESAWADGDRFTERGNWAMHFTYALCEPDVNG